MAGIIIRFSAVMAIYNNISLFFFLALSCQSGTHGEMEGRDLDRPPTPL